MQDLLKYVPNDLKLKVTLKLQNVTKGWKNLRNGMVKVIKVITD